MFRSILACAIGAGAMLFGAAADAAICQKWSPPERIGLLDVRVIKEASGVAVSRRFPGRLYHNNDSGDGPNIYVTDAAANGARTVTIAGFVPKDVEDIALGPCAGAPSCLYVGDIGDNAERRESVTFVVLAETAAFEGAQTPLRTITAKYPDRAHNAESFAIHPNGDLFLITKPVDLANRRALPAQIFRLTAAQLADTGGQAQTFEQVSEIDLPFMLWENNLPGQIATGMDIAPDGDRFALITYQSAVEVGLDLAKPLKPSRTWVPGRDYQVIATAPLPQAEAIAYTLDAKGLIYDTEFTENPAWAPIHLPSNGEAPLYRQVCEKGG
jgi:hypothetical protein